MKTAQNEEVDYSPKQKRRRATGPASPSSFFTETPNFYGDLAPARFRWLIPIALVVVGVGAFTIAAILATNQRETLGLDEGPDVENYDIVGGKPFIYSICE